MSKQFQMNGAALPVAMNSPKEERIEEMTALVAEPSQRTFPSKHSYRPFRH